MGKTPFQRHREEEERKKKREEEEAAKLYEDFVESFGDKDEESGKSFVQGDTIQPGSIPSLSGSSKKTSNKYVPSFMPPAMANAFGKDEKPKKSEQVQPTPASSKGKTRNIDKMLETMKRDQDARSERQKARRERGSSFDLGPQVDDGMGSFDDGDPYTTNLYVGNLAATVDEEVLKQEFLRYGDIASIKVMWPRDDDQRRRGRNCGFVAFMTRAGAEKAKDELNGIVLHDLDLKIGWGKAVVLPPIPVYTQSGKGGLAPMLAAAKAKAASAYALTPGLPAPAPWQVPPPVTDPNPHSGLGQEIRVVTPEDMRVRFIIDSVATYVMVDGCDFEQALMSKEASNPEFMFLFDLSCPEHAYYRWRLYSLAQGDSLRNWRNEPFVMVEGGPRWIPPSMTAMSHGKEQTAAQRGGEAKDKDRPLSDLQRDRFEDILRALTMERSKICEAMVFAVDNADSAWEIVEILSDSLTLSETPMTTKVARLMLASDILHNSTAPVRNASRYRSLLEGSLPDVFESLQETYRSLESRMHQEVLRRNILRVLRIWRSWFIFSDDFLNGLQATFLKAKSSTVQNPALKEELDQLDDEALALRCRRNGVSRQGGKASQIDRLLNLQAYLSGETDAGPAVKPMPAAQEPLPAEVPLSTQGVFALNAQPEDVKAEKKKEEAAGPVLGPVAKPEPKQEVKKEAKQPVDGPVSKWTMVDYDDEDSVFPGVQEDKADDIFQDLEKTPVVDSGRAPAPGPPSPEPDALAGSRDSMHAADPAEALGGGERIDAAEEGRRARLRQVEVELLLFRESLEDEGLPKGEVEQKVNDQRERLLAGSSARAYPTELPSTSNRDADRHEGKEPQPSTRSRPSKDIAGEQSGKPAKADHGRHKERKDGSKVKERDREKDRGKTSAKAKEHGKDSRRHEKSRSRSPERRRSRSRSRERSREPRHARSWSRDRSRERRRSVSQSRHAGHGSHKDRGTSAHDKAKSTADRSPAASKKRGRSVPRDDRHGTSRHDAGKKDKKERRERSRSRTPKKGRHNRDSRKQG